MIIVLVWILTKYQLSFFNLLQNIVTKQSQNVTSSLHSELLVKLDSGISETPALSRWRKQRGRFQLHANKVRVD